MHVHIAIIGLDRLSASMGLALKRYQSQPRAEHTFTIIGSDQHTHAMKTAEQLGAVDNFQRSLSKAAENANLVVINAPYSEREDTYQRLGKELKPGAVVIDLSELKQPAIDLAKAHFPTNAQGAPVAYLVGMTPIVNVKALFSGDLEVEGARADLFDSSDVILTPDTGCPSEAITLAEDIVRLMGGQPRFMDPREHDGLIAATEQLPALLGTALFYTLQQSEGWTDFRRMVNPTLALTMHTLARRTATDDLDLFGHNQANLVRHLDSLISTLKEMRTMLDGSGNPALLEVFLTRVHSEWDRWDVKRHSGQWEESGPIETLPGVFGSMGGILMGRRDKARDSSDES